MAKKEINEKMNIAHRILVEPVITEAATMLAEKNKYVFKVTANATKDEIKKSIKEVYGVTAEKVNTIHIPRKFKVRGKVSGWKSGYRKAIVTVKKGESIDIFEK